MKAWCTIRRPPGEWIDEARGYIRRPHRPSRRAPKRRAISQARLPCVCRGSTWALSYLEAGNYPYSSFATTIFDFAVVGGDPASKVVAFMPGGVVSDQMQGLRAPLLELLAAPSKKPRGYGAHRPTYGLREAPSTRYVIVISRYVRAFSLDRFTRHFRDKPLADVPDASGWFHTLGADPID
jgi:hypothetical protein